MQIASTLTNNGTNVIKILDLGRQHYLETWTLQKEIQNSLIAGTGKPTLILCEHNPVITLGRSANPKHLLLSKERLNKLGIEVYEIERGGDVTWHGPGQLVCYPLLNLKTKKTDVNWYMRTLEDVIIDTLTNYKIKGIKLAGKTGVWVNSKSNSAKIAAIGIRISRWCTLHGFSINIKDCRAGFELINPCGLGNIAITSIEQETNSICSLTGFKTNLIASFCKVFNYDLT